MSAATLDRELLLAWLGAFRDVSHDQRDRLTELDAAIGDADHGSNLARGTDAVMAKLDGLAGLDGSGGEPADLGALLKTAGMTLVSSVGGASGPLYGTFFLRAGGALAGTETADTAAVAAALRAGIEGVVARGKAEAGDKTMYDALAPALAAFESVVAESGSLAAAATAAAEAAEAGRDATEPLIARKGRASYLGERSAGHLDPGATSAALLLRALAETVG